MGSNLRERGRGKRMMASSNVILHFTRMVYCVSSPASLLVNPSTCIVLSYLWHPQPPMEWWIALVLSCSSNAFVQNWTYCSLAKLWCSCNVIILCHYIYMNVCHTLMWFCRKVSLHGSIEQRPASLPQSVAWSLPWLGGVGFQSRLGLPFIFISPHPRAFKL